MAAEVKIGKCRCSNQFQISLLYKGTGPRDYNSVLVVWFDRPWIGESPADIHHFLTVSLILH